MPKSGHSNRPQQKPSTTASAQPKPSQPKLAPEPKRPASRGYLIDLARKAEVLGDALAYHFLSADLRHALRYYRENPGAVVLESLEELLDYQNRPVVTGLHELSRALYTLGEDAPDTPATLQS